MTRMTMLKSKSSKCFANSGSAVVTFSENHLKVKALNVCPSAAQGERKCDIVSGLFHCRMYQDKLASLKRQLQQLQEGNHLFSFDRNVWCRGETGHSQILTGYSWLWLRITSSAQQFESAAPVSVLKEKPAEKQTITNDKQSSTNSFLAVSTYSVPRPLYCSNWCGGKCCGLFQM